MDAIKKPANRPSLEGVTLEMIVMFLSENMGWEAMAAGEGGAVIFVADAQLKCVFGGLSHRLRAAIGQ